VFLRKASDDARAAHRYSRLLAPESIRLRSIWVRRPTARPTQSDETKRSQNPSPAPPHTLIENTLVFATPLWDMLKRLHLMLFTGVSMVARSPHSLKKINKINYLIVFPACLWALACGPTGSGTPVECEGAETACGDVCVDTASDIDHCGGCDIACADGESCIDGACSSPECEPGATESCYDGLAGTEGIGPCVGGTRTCGDNGFFGACVGQVTPVNEACGNGVDDNCNGVVDEEADEDGDGFTNCRGDCCDSAGTECGTPALVNPGAFEVTGNEVDDDCDGVVDNELTACDSGLPSDSADGLQYAAAMDLCQFTVEDPPTPEERRWGVISAQFTLSSGSGTPNANQRSIRPGFAATPTQFGDSVVALSTGHAAATGDVNPSFAAFQGGQDLGRTASVPADWLAANGGNFPNAPGCPEPQGGTTANDPIMLTLRVRVPTNALSFSMSTNFFSTEYPEWVCSAFNDFFVVLLDSSFDGDPANPADKNLARYTAPDMSEFPVGVNLAFGNTGLFQQCLNGPTGCGSGSVAGNVTTCLATNELAGTGFDVVNPPSQFPDDPAVCGASNLAGGSTSWLLTSGNVTPGEIITLRFAIWDTGDPFYDSLVLLDNFQWSVEASEPGTVVVD
jgi:hypothetical protein